MAASSGEEDLVDTDDYYAWLGLSKDVRISENYVPVTTERVNPNSR